jgi:hypothetical protein
VRVLKTLRKASMRMPVFLKSFRLERFFKKTLNLSWKIDQVLITFALAFDEGAKKSLVFKQIKQKSKKFQGNESKNSH